MIELIIAIIMGLASPGHTTADNNNATAVIANNPGDTGGETGQLPPR